jgi:uncharacterized protein (DUF2141 family)
MVSYIFKAVLSRKGLSIILTLVGLAIALAVSFGPGILFGHTMTVHIKDLRSQEGLVQVVLYDNAQAFKSNSIANYVDYSTVKVSSSSVEVVYRHIKPGTYALVLHHDENSDGVFDMVNDLPTEGWGYSNNVGAQTTPSYKAASFSFGSTFEDAVLEKSFSRPIVLTTFYSN